MKNIYFIIIALFFSLVSKSQTSKDIGKISLSVVVPEYMEDLSESQLSKLDTKISQIVTASGLSDSGYGNNFVIYPKFAVNETSVVEGGMQNITVVSVDFSLFVKQVDNNILFSTISKTIKGSGSSKELALTNAITKIAANDAGYKKFIDESKTKIFQYYETKCSDLIKKSDGFVKTQQYEEALGLLMSIPDAVSCYSQVQVKAIEAYKGFQKKNCAKQMQLARNTIATNDYVEALNILSEIDPSSPCFKESQTIAKVAEGKVNAEEKKQWDFQMKQYNDEVSLEKQRVNAIKDIAVSYYKSQTSDINYTVIVK
ncbi:hypothetical protein [Flavobacterium sp. ov086]|uniref:hypothetical protein n=1 Tax=Flavobacterium sp. ov086 TaxID=1761785 RepID=UPI000B667EA7|nr:hypothetical protein [Flavobacterium sp. ov086]SNR71662.1 hypothetical protein SAMN04487979_1187 [Flavobacterium sp. ov086]